MNGRAFLDSVFARQQNHVIREVERDLSKGKIGKRNRLPVHNVIIAVIASQGAFVTADRQLGTAPP